MVNQEVKNNMIIIAIFGVSLGLGAFSIAKAIRMHQSIEYDACMAHQERFVRDKHPDTKESILRVWIDDRVKKFCKLN